MDELRKALEQSMKGEKAKKALAEFKDQIRDWNVPLPHVDVVLSDFGLNEFKVTELIECWIANELEAGYCGKYLFVFDGQSCPMHMHKEKHETFFIVKGEVEMTYDGTTSTMLPGDLLPVEPHKYHGFIGRGPALLLEISKPCVINDNYFENTKIPFGGNHTPEN